MCGCAFSSRPSPAAARSIIRASPAVVKRVTLVHSGDTGPAAANVVQHRLSDFEADAKTLQAGCLFEQPLLKFLR
jgi:hypothetical protein